MQWRQGQADLDRHTVRHGDDAMVLPERLSIDFRDTQGHVRSQTKGATTIDGHRTSAHDLRGIRFTGVGIRCKQDQVGPTQALPREWAHHIVLMVKIETRASRASRGQQR